MRTSQKDWSIVLCDLFLFSFYSSWFAYSTSICTICERRLLKALLNRNPKKEKNETKQKENEISSSLQHMLERNADERG
jgi:formate dehydrogenase assembly factor FdhD